jgi:maltose alpha-D-glucosyltransferase/alpha-amylase
MFLALAREDASPLARALETLPPIPQDCQWANFVRNHDELTLDKLSEEERQEVFAAFGPEKELQLYGRGLRRRLPTMLDGDQRRIRLAYSLAFSLPGTPVLFYGEEIGMAENLAIEGRYSVRAPMQWSPDPQAGFTTADEPCRPLVEDGPFSYREVNAAVFAHRCDWEDSTVVAVHNLAGREASVRLVLGDEGELVDLFEDEDHGLDAGEVTLKLEPYGYRWFRLRRPGARLPP